MGAGDRALALAVFLNVFRFRGGGTCMYIHISVHVRSTYSTYISEADARMHHLHREFFCPGVCFQHVSRCLSLVSDSMIRLFRMNEWMVISSDYLHCVVYMYMCHEQCYLLLWMRSSIWQREEGHTISWRVWTIFIDGHILALMAQWGSTRPDRQSAFAEW